MNNIIRNETSHSINGVTGRLFALHRPPAPWKAGTFANQTWVSESRPIRDYGQGALMKVEIRFDDQCKNGHNNFAITAEVTTPGSKRRKDVQACGCLHDDIAKVFPELAPLIKWHLCSTDGPMHYIANTTYFAGDLDCSGRAKGQACAWDYGYRFDDVPVITKVKKSFYDWIEARHAFNASTPKTNPAHGEFRVVAIAHESKPGDTYKFGPKFTFVGFGEKWHECPFDDEATAQGMAEALNKHKVHAVKIVTSFSEGKAREFDAARSCAVWPEATNEQLSLPKAELTALLEARLPALLTAMRADIEAAGFMWQCPIE